MNGKGKVTDTIYERSIEKVFVHQKKINGLSDRNHGMLTLGDTVIETAMVQAEGMHAGADAFVQAINQLAAAGSIAERAMFKWLLPVNSEEKTLKEQVKEAEEVARKLQIGIGQSDASQVEGLNYIVAIVTVYGRANSLFVPEPAKVNQDVIMAGYAGWKGTALLAEVYQEELEKHFSSRFMQPILAARKEEMFSCIPAVTIAEKAGVRQMLAAGEGGIHTALWTLAKNAGLGISVMLKDIAIRQETVEICDYLGLSLYQLMSDGVLLMTAAHGQKVLAEMAAAGIPAVIIGHITDDNDRVIINEDETRYLEPFRQDSLWEAKGMFK